MNGQQTIEVTVTAEGHVSVETKGYVGQSCQDATRFLEQALGTATNTRRTAAYYASEPQSHRETERG